MQNNNSYIVFSATLIRCKLLLFLCLYRMIFCLLWHLLMLRLHRVPFCSLWWCIKIRCIHINTLFLIPVITAILRYGVRFMDKNIYSNTHIYIYIYIKNNANAPLTLAYYTPVTYQTCSSANGKPWRYNKGWLCIQADSRSNYIMACNLYLITQYLNMISLNVVCMPFCSNAFLMQFISSSFSNI